MTPTTSAIHPLDHLVLPTQTVDTARIRLTALGFVVAPTGIHPFGTENCCVFLADGTYLEPLAIGSEQAATEAAAEGNVFVARDRLYRESLGNEGFSAVVLGTDNADDDHERYVEAGLSAGDTLSFSRAFTDTAGKSDTASFKLAFASANHARDAFLFACQRINAPKVDRAALQAHPNGVDGVVEVIAISSAPSEQHRLIAVAVNEPSAGGPDGAFALPNATLRVLGPASYAARFGIPTGPATELRFAAVVFAIRSADAAARLLAANSIQHDIAGTDIVVPPAAGQGAAFIFRETK
ncbi:MULTISPECIES: VOC family protein [unclassified Mesorhizobium]|uniref:VOC family protein n=1 Tax=unclassified Mesorhizobium TaxID=325217 RepID=UPI000FD72AB4|nr:MULTISPECIES: VOC family protein [unclassified Mesorhizobium]TGR58036.1 VOC family protein [bacterium M00.F.Ca.ET.199.01.1.1]TGU41859.1 VOC family protein [bacterium M00.F.Ca.ET.156.01.1.1]TGV89519.1 VOC family protein [Mesorhizobium sp. M00.F.Ca.ET.149.01.1.1]TGR32777.1 VOC family protein [Mesorhizobium sp. M8A.F.Ca.ET.197.01.1.1]TGR34425.1 VOC family protein [Mesorhizobium sp. M8A.F.Ca.ET.202.01.1.1]